MIILWTVCAFVSGSLMFSYWLGLIARTNIKNVGDGNPGASNLWRAAGYKWGIVGILLDFLKGYLILIGLSSSVNGYEIVPLAIAPIIGHVYSPFLKGKGGKAIAVTFGVWSALTQFEVALVYALILALLLGLTKVIIPNKPTSTDADGLQVVVGMLFVVIYLCIRDFPNEIRWVGFGNFVVLGYTHRNEFNQILRKILRKVNRSDKQG
ncbi:glycerol-3-phosphate acyltransferase [Paenibacillus sp. SYP-B3998]|uniref:Glycerol-3-phosphate acyltransferase n=1 Tax=Paenibacillus sp. SYP-B3998 TaxID=2678564 RepID=A0A6G3ZRU5_9BACL|nr:glycerol-3-phosphate acyltransferase [Paenibacillus sp. SYP-B3998]NEW04758.1 glycerol-3-phosphate acyltransferase [Paenibacillus sp. SYP-B3998]